MLATDCVLDASPVELGALTCVWALVFILPVAPWILLEGVPPLLPGLFEVVFCWLELLPEFPPLLDPLFPLCEVFPPPEPLDDVLLEGGVAET